MNQYTPELLFIRHCIRNESNSIHEFDQNLIQGINWPSLVSLCRHHRVGHAVYQMVKTLDPTILPAKYLRRLDRIKKEYIFSHFRRTFALLQISNAFQQCDIPLINFKGIILDHWLYGGSGQRYASDIDILVAPDDVIRAWEILFKLGYRVNNIVPDNFRLDSKIGAAYRARHAEIHYDNADTGIRVELHWRLVAPQHSPFPDTRELLAYGIHYSLQSGQRIYTLNETEHILYLFYHGTNTWWYRLFWLVDCLKLMHHQRVDWESVCALAKERNLLPVVLLGCKLATEVLHAKLPQPIARLSSETVSLTPHVTVQPKHQYLPSVYHPLLENLCANAEVLPQKGQRANLQLHLQLQWLLNPNVMSRMDVLLRFIQPQIADWEWISLPDRFYYFYFILRPCRWVLRGIQYLIVRLRVKTKKW